MVLWDGGIKMKVKELLLRIEELEEETGKLKQRNKELRDNLKQSERRVDYWRMLYEGVYEKMQRRCES